jgi:hypothetical protein
MERMRFGQLMAREAAARNRQPVGVSDRKSHVTVSKQSARSRRRRRLDRIRAAGWHQQEGAALLEPPQACLDLKDHRIEHELFEWLDTRLLSKRSASFVELDEIAAR